MPWRWENMVAAPVDLWRFHLFWKRNVDHGAICKIVWRSIQCVQVQEKILWLSIQCVCKCKRRSHYVASSVGASAREDPVCVCVCMCLCACRQERYHTPPPQPPNPHYKCNNSPAKREAPSPKNENIIFLNPLMNYALQIQSLSSKYSKC